MNASTARLSGVDLLKGLASQVIVLHHLSAYGPLSDTAADLAPGLANWLYDYGRMAVQVFLVAGGFLAAKGLDARAGATAAPPLAALARRYLRLAVPYVAALALSVAGAALADLWLDDEAIPSLPTAAQFLAHALLLHDILGYPSLLAGAWYVPIDFQLFAMTALLLWVGRSAFAGRALVLGLAAASLLAFNRDADWDPWGLYFLGAYGLGLAAWWSSTAGGPAAWAAAMAALAVAALVLDFRLRIALALAVAAALFVGTRVGLLERVPRTRPGAFLGRISFALFLVHFPVCLLANAAYARLGGDSPAAAVALGLGAWAGSIGLATLFHRWVEVPSAAWSQARAAAP